MGAVKEERDQYKSDIDDSELSKDQLIKKAWEVRDAAVKRKNTAEIDLAKERIATMQINSQVRQTQKLSNPYLKSTNEAPQSIMPNNMGIYLKLRSRLDQK